MTSTTGPPAERARTAPPPRWVWLLYAAIVALSAAFTALVIAPEVRFIGVGGDAHDYVQLAEQWLATGTFWHPIRTYGYPLFLAAIRAVLPADCDWLTATRVVQFLLHTASAALAVGLFTRFATVARLAIAWPAQVAVFALVQLNPVLLGLSQEVLTDSISVFLATAFFAGLLSNTRWHWLLAGLALGAAAVVRPFYLNFAIALAVLVGLWWLVRWVRKTAPRPEALPARLLMIAVPLLLVLLPQFALVYQNEGRVGFTGAQGSGWVSTHLEYTYYYYKYETYIGEWHGPKVLYLSPRRAVMFEQRDPTQPMVLLMALDPVGTGYMTAIKTAGLFQNYEYAVYRSHLDNRFTHPTFLYGFVLFVQFMYLVGLSLLEFRSFVLENHPVLVTALAIVALHVGLYSLLTAPESRFIAPVFPLLTAFAGFNVIARPRIRLMMGVVVASILLYAYTYIELLDSQR